MAEPHHIIHHELKSPLRWPHVDVQGKTTVHVLYMCCFTLLCQNTLLISSESGIPVKGVTL